MNITGCSVRVMVSHDYCHFEVTLGATLENGCTDAVKIARVDALRKEAQRLADKSVAQYKIYKRALSIREGYTYRQAVTDAEEAEKTPESERTPEQKAVIKLKGDLAHAAGYNYEDDWKFQEGDE